MSRRLYNIYFNSGSAISGTWNDAYFQVNLITDPFSDKYDYYCAVENFTLDSALTTAFIVVMPNVSIGSTYSTLNKTNQNIILLNNGLNFSEAITTKSVGNKISDLSSFMNNIIHIQILNANNGALAQPTNVGTTPNWNMLLTIYGELRYKVY